MHFNDLPNEIILMICRFLSPIQVINAFLSYDFRMFSCITEYHLTIDLSKCSYTDLQVYLNLLVTKRIQPLTLTISNVSMPTQIKIFFDAFSSILNFCFNHVHQLSLLECTTSDISNLEFDLRRFELLRSLRIVEAEWNNYGSSIDYSKIEYMRNLLFNNNLNSLTELELSIREGIVLDKQQRPKLNLKRLTITLQTVDDLFILFDGLTPNLIFLNVTIRLSTACKRSSIPRFWPQQLMSHLIEFQITTDQKVALTLDHLRGIVMSLAGVEKFVIDVKQWVSKDQKFIEGNQMEMLFSEFMPQLRHFHCFIKTAYAINIQTFATLSKRWPLTCKPKLNRSDNYLYTIPWSFEQLDVSLLADDDTISICPNVRYLTVDVPCTNVSRRFPNIRMLNVLSKCNVSFDDNMKFPRLRHLTAADVKIVSLLSIKNIQMLTLFDQFTLLKSSTIYSNVLHLILENNRIASLEAVIALVQCFPNLHSLKIKLPTTTEYYDCLDILLDGVHLPYLWLFKTNCITEFDSCSSISVWISAKTPLKWKLTPFYGHRNYNTFTVCL
ncbi:unnamed protein product [Rotaria socialis]|uniref:F-box domain-containing protein n=1 Tax=Rotaria socialis TaxID=392032 RepID=A0A817XNA6_9BILA|nr:unnamed protein product [Rotaria socialis]